MNGGERDALAPVIPLFDTVAAGESAQRRTARVAETSAADEQATADADRDAAERALVRKLGARSLSVREARTVLAGRGLSSEAIDEIVEGFARRGYLDDSALAEQLVHSGTERKGQGRQALAQTLAKRGVSRDVADAAIRELPDDDAERALEFARSRAGSMGNLAPDAALRRLVGQLSRRGYGGSAAMTAAREALREAASDR